MVKLIASDLDGTLLQNGAQSLSAEALELIKKARSAGIQFVAASGRQYSNMKRMFSQVWEDIIFVAENGSLIVYRDEILDKTVIPRDLAGELIRDIRERDGCDVMISGVHSVYMQPKPKSRPYVDYILYDMKSTVTLADNLLDINEDIVKISSLVYDDDPYGLEAEIGPKWSKRFNVAVAGKEWLDFTMTNKGEAIEKLRGRLKIEREEIVAFGDNFNDRAMFKAAGYSYAMAGAKDEVRQSARHCCESVENVLRNLISYLDSIN